MTGAVASERVTEAPKGSLSAAGKSREECKGRRELDCADLSSALCLLVMTVLGIPVSTTHTKTSAIMGVGAVRRLSAINFGVVRDMMLTWVFTFPGCGLISFVMAKLFMVVF